ncbi:MAG: DUF309 domain-containing protein [Nitrospiraceae bacterium]
MRRGAAEVNCRYIRAIEIMIEPSPPDPDWPRYATHPFPPYRFIPGKTPHPRRSPLGHSYGQPEFRPPALPPEQWRENAWYLYGVDLYNFAYWWECHEVFESLWHAAGHNTDPGRFFQGLIQIAAANLKQFVGTAHATEHLVKSGIERLQKFPQFYMGMDVRMFLREVQSYFHFHGGCERPALIRLAFFRPL